MSTDKRKANDQRLRAGGLEKIGHLFRQHYSALLAYGVKLCGDREVAEDAIQQVFVELCQKSEPLEGVKNSRAYLYTSIRHRINRRQRKDARRLEQRLGIRYQTDVEFSPEDLLVAVEHEFEMARQLKQLISTLPWRQREAVYLRYYDNLSTEEIAEVMGISRQGVLNTLYKAIKVLRTNENVKLLFRILLPLGWTSLCSLCLLRLL